MGRDENKQEKLARIRAAAEHLFAKKGFEGTSVAAVAARAKVAKGTVFLYAETKADLVALVFEARLHRALEEGIAGLDLGAPLVPELVRLYARFFAAYRPIPELAKLFVSSLVFAGGNAGRIQSKLAGELLSALTTHLAARIARGELAGDLSPSIAAANLHALYLFALVGWLGGSFPSDGRSPEEHALAYLERSMETAYRGLRSR